MMHGLAGLLTRKARVIASIVLVIISFGVFMLSSMAGPNQLHFLEITVACDAGLIILAAL